jgi:hypothetical protein
LAKNHITEGDQMRRALAAVVAALVLTGCSGTDSDAETDNEATASSSPSASESAAESPSAEPTEDDSEDAHADAIAVEIKGDEVEPRGKRVKVGVGEEITLHVESDRPAELHVHSSPEQTLKAPKGETMLTLTVDTPGVVDVEEHDTGIVVLQLEVR